MVDTRSLYQVWSQMMGGGTRLTSPPTVCLVITFVLSMIFFFFFLLSISRGSPHTSQISQWLVYPSLWLVISELNIRFCHCLLYKLLLRYQHRSAISSAVATRFCKLQEPLTRLQISRGDCISVYVYTQSLCPGEMEGWGGGGGECT